MSKKVGRELAKLRKRQELTQREVADAVSVAHGAVANWEMGRSLPRQKYWKRYASVLGTTMDVFFVDRPSRARAS